MILMKINDSGALNGAITPRVWFRFGMRQTQASSKRWSCNADMPRLTTVECRDGRWRWTTWGNRMSDVVGLGELGDRRVVGNQHQLLAGTILERDRYDQTVDCLQCRDRCSVRHTRRLVIRQVLPPTWRRRKPFGELAIPTRRWPEVGGARYRSAQCHQTGSVRSLPDHPDPDLIAGHHGGTV